MLISLIVSVVYLFLAASISYIFSPVCFLLICRSVYRSVDLSIDLSINLSLLSFYSHICSSFSLSFCLPINLSLCLYVSCCLSSFLIENNIYFCTYRFTDNWPSLNYDTAEQQSFLQSGYVVSAVGCCVGWLS